MQLESMAMKNFTFSKLTTILALTLSAVALPVYAAASNRSDISSRLAKDSYLDSRIQKVLGTVSFHDGPNGYNAASLAKGFTDHVGHTSNMEFRYYLTHFCEPTDSPTRRGDLVVVEKLSSSAEGELIHAMTTWTPRTAFEKFSAAGLNGTFSDKGNADYRFTHFEDSNPVKNCGEGCQITNYSCQKVGRVRETLKSCQNKKPFEAISLMRRNLEALSLNSKKDISEDYNKLIDFEQWMIHRVQGLDVTDDCALFYLSSWQSIVGHLDHLALQNLNKRISVAPPEKLKIKIRGLADRLKNQLTDEKSKRILEENTW